MSERSLLPFARRAVKNSRGAAMILVLFAFVLVLTLGTAALVAADAANSTATDGVLQKQAEYAALSYAESLTAQLALPDSGLCKAARELEEGGTLAVEGDFTSPDGTFALSGMLAEYTRSGDTLSGAIRCVYAEQNSYALSVTLQLVEQEGRGKAWQLLAYAPAG